MTSAEASGSLTAFDRVIADPPRNRCTSGLEGMRRQSLRQANRVCEFVHEHFAHSVGLVTDTRYQGWGAARTRSFRPPPGPLGRYRPFVRGPPARTAGGERSIAQSLRRTA